jgi:hypothetical protein
MSETLPPPLPFAAEAVGSTQTAGQSVDEGRGRIFPCPQCGADLTFHIGQQRMRCPYCAFEKDLEPPGQDIQEQDFDAALERLQELRESGRHDETGQNEIRCESCGGTTVFVGSLTSSECPYCGSPIQRDKVHSAEHRIPVDGVLPFLLERDKAAANLRAWVRSRWFAPNDFRERGAEGKFNGVYLPYWTFDTLTANSYSGARGEYYYVTVGHGKNRRTQRRTRWYPASGAFQKFFDDVLVLATSGMNRPLMQALEPWNLGRCIPFNQEVLAGYLARTYELDLEAAFPEAKARIDEAIDAEVRARIGGDTQRVDAINSNYGALTYKHLLLPVWLLAYRYQAHTYQVMINATTGEVQGERPYSWIKITLACIAGALVAAIVGILISRS